MEEKSKGLNTTEAFVIQYIPSYHFFMHVLRMFYSCHFRREYNL